MGGVAERTYREAYQQGYTAYWETNGNPWRTKNPYVKGTRKYREFNRGWNASRKEKQEVSQVFLEPVILQKEPK